MDLLIVVDFVGNLPPISVVIIGSQISLFSFNVCFSQSRNRKFTETGKIINRAMVVKSVRKYYLILNQ